MRFVAHMTAVMSKERLEHLQRTKSSILQLRLYSFFHSVAVKCTTHSLPLAQTLCTEPLTTGASPALGGMALEAPDWVGGLVKAPDWV